MTPTSPPATQLEARNPAADTAPAASGPWLVALSVWTLVLCFVPDPRPLGAPEWAVTAVRSAAGLDEAGARAIATLLLRAGGLVLLGLLCTLAVGARRWDRRAVLAVVLAPALAIATMWIDFGYFPIRLQLLIAAGCAVLGAVAGLAVRRNVPALVACVAATAGVFAWGLSTGIDDDLDAAARSVGRHVLDSAAEIPDGDAGFVRALEVAFGFAAASSRGADPVLPNRAAVLALGVILGEEKVARVAGRHVDPGRLPEVEALRERITLHGRKDWPRHFWVSAALTLLSDADRSITVGLTKELMDATPGGTGFSFTDLAADAAGNRFARAAIRDAEAARAMQIRIQGGVQPTDVCPDVHDLPEGLSREVFHERYGGLGGAGTKEVVADIVRRLEACALLN